MARPTKYKAEYDEQAYKLALLGATDKQLADFWEVEEQTINNWKIAHPSFFESLKRGKSEADAKVADALYNRALGFEHEEEKIFQYEGKIVRAKTKKKYPPETTAGIFWLKNRQPEQWRDKHEMEHSGSLETKLVIDEALDE